MEKKVEGSEDCITYAPGFFTIVHKTCLIVLIFIFVL